MNKKNKKNYNKIYLSIFVILLIVSYIGLDYSKGLKNSSITGQNIAPSGSSGTTQQVILHTATLADYERLEQIAPQNEIIQKLPDKAKLLISFYNFDSGSREWERDYIITKDNIEQGTAEDVDIKMMMHSRWLSILNQNNFCNVIKSSKANGDFATELVISKAKLLWKYKSIMGYKDCLGL